MACPAAQVIPAIAQPAPIGTGTNPAPLSTQQYANLNRSYSQIMPNPPHELSTTPDQHDAQARHTQPKPVGTPMRRLPVVHSSHAVSRRLRAETGDPEKTRRGTGYQRSLAAGWRHRHDLPPCRARPPHPAWRRLAHHDFAASLAASPPAVHLATSAPAGCRRLPGRAWSGMHPTGGQARLSGSRGMIRGTQAQPLAAATWGRPGSLHRRHGIGRHGPGADFYREPDAFAVAQQFPDNFGARRQLRDPVEHLRGPHHRLVVQAQ